MDTVNEKLGELPKRGRTQIWKFPLRISDASIIEMPFNAEVICVQMQRHQPCIWAKGCDFEQATTLRVFCVYGTGHPMFDAEQTYVGTVQDDTLVWHVFEISPHSVPLFFAAHTFTEAV